VNKRRNVRMQFQVVQGTPAGSPVQPSVPAGYVKLAAFYIEATWNTQLDEGYVMDYRVPVGLKIVDVVGPNWDHLENSDSVTVWVAGAGTLAKNPGDANDRYAYAICNPGTWLNGRILKVGFGGKRQAASTGALSIVRIDQLPDGGSQYPEAVITTDYAGSSLHPTAGSGDVEYRELSLMTGEPVWTNGYRSGFAPANANFTPPFTGGAPYSPEAIPRMALKYLAKSGEQDSICIARFYVACGL
jgi:hypothetical protein